MKITCPECNERFEVSADMVGKKAKCGECAHVFIVPEMFDRKPKKSKEPVEESVDVRETAWLSLYLAGIAVLLMLYSGYQGGMIANLVLRLAIETASLFLVWKGFSSIWPYRNEAEYKHLVSTAVMVNGILLALMALSLLLSLYVLVAGSNSSGLGSMGGLGDIMKNLNDIQKQLPE